MSKNDRFVTRRPEGWAVKKAGAERASSNHSHQADAERAAKQIVDGRWRDSDSVAPSNDPFPPRDRKH